VTVPGVVAGWGAIAALGASRPLHDLLAPAITLAAEGVAVSPGLQRAIQAWLDRAHRPAGSGPPASAATAFGPGAGSGPFSEFGPGAAGSRLDPGLSALLLDSVGRPRAGLVQPALAATLTAIAGDGDTFYRGDLGLRLAAGLRALGSPLDAADLAAHHADVTDPLTAVVDGVTWHAAPPPVQGATFLAIAGSRDLLADARRAQRARDALLGDPRTGPVDLDGLLLRAPFPAGVAEAGPKPGGDTVAIAAVDSDGNAVTLIQSVFESFGSGLLDPGTGLVLHNRGSSFSLDPAHPARIGPGIRPPHTLCPTIATTSRTVLALGCQGGRNQPWILAQVAADALDSSDLPGVLARPRWVLDGPALVLEPGTPGAAALAADAPALGLQPRTTAGPHDGAGHVQMARLDGAGLAAAGDPRADGLGAILA
jgi:gamma-glutamyltranspeptidase